MLKSEEIVEYIDHSIGFYFDGGFSQMIKDGKLNQKEIQVWLNLAVLYNESTREIGIQDSERENVYSLIEDLFTSCKVELLTEGNLKEVDLDEIGNGYDFDREPYMNIVKNAYNIVLKHGMDLSFLAKPNT